MQMMRIAMAVVLAGGAAAFGCSGGSTTAKDAGADATDPPAGWSLSSDGGLPGDLPPWALASCSIMAPTACPNPPPQYADIAPIIGVSCVPCHSGIGAESPWALTDYEHVVDWIDVIHDQLISCQMPPLDGGVPLSAEGRLTILSWIKCAGAP
jgi:hypothetical protein